VTEQHVPRAAAVKGGLLAEIRAEQTRQLFGAVVAVPINALTAAIAAALLWRSLPALVLLAWLGAIILVTLARLGIWRSYRRAPDRDRHAARWAWRHTVGTLAVSIVWGMVCLALPAWGLPRDYLFVTFVFVGISAVAVASLGAFLPALLAYILPALLMLAAACLACPADDFTLIGLLVLLYAAVISIAGFNANQRIRAAACLQIDNVSLNGSLRAAMAEVERAKQDKWTTLAHLSHEMRTPLNAILGFSEAMQAQLFGPLGNVKYRDYAQHVHSGGEHLLRLADEIFDLSSGETGALALIEGPIDVADLVGTCVELYTPKAEAAQLSLAYASGAGLPQLEGDATKLRRLLLHLLDNAVKFTPAGGAIAVDASCDAAGRITLAVRDTGIGMDQGDVPRALLPFVRLSTALVRETEGSGLGLPICKRLAELHGAEFGVTSARGAGTLCTVRFPASRSVRPARIQAA
jgi:signal transduction histidine kinase